MAILGNSVQGASTTPFGAGRKIHSPFTLASAGTLTELHAWLLGTIANHAVLSIYADSSGLPGALVAYTSSLAFSGSSDVNQTGFSVPLAAGTYWIGLTAQTGSTGGAYYAASGNRWQGISTTAGYPIPSDPYGTPDLSNASRNLSVWAVYSTTTTWNGSSTVSLTDTVTTSGVIAPHADFIGTPLTGTPPFTVTFTDLSTA